MLMKISEQKFNKIFSLNSKLKNLNTSNGHFSSNYKIIYIELVETDFKTR